MFFYLSVKNTRLKKAIATAADAKKISTKECLDKCLETLGLSEVKAARLKYWTKSPKERTEWMMDKIEESAKINGKKFFSIFDGKSACMKCFCLLYNISKTVYYKNQNKMQSGRTSSGIKKQRRRSEPQIEAHSWLNHYSTCFGDKMPDRDEIFLPYKFRKRAVYEKYSYEKTQKMKQPVALSSFMRMWKKDFRWLKIKKVSSQTLIYGCIWLS